MEKCSGFDEEYRIVVAGYCVLADAYVEIFWEVERYDWNEVSRFEFPGMFADDCRLEKVYQTSRKNLDGPRKSSLLRFETLLTMQNFLKYTKTTSGELSQRRNCFSSMSRMDGNHFARS